MATSAYRLKELRRLSVSERIQLVEDLWDSIAEDDVDSAFPVAPELAAELDRRMAAYKRDPSTGEDWAVVRTRITQRLRDGSTAARTRLVSRRKK